MVGKGDFQVICRICNKPLKLGIDTAADEGKRSTNTPVSGDLSVLR